MTVAGRRRVAELLVAATKEHDWATPVDEAVSLARRLRPEDVLEAASYHRVVGCVLAAVEGSDETPPELLAALAGAARRASGRTMLATAALRAVRAALGDDVDWLVVKGPVLDSVVYPRPRLRSFTDLDVLVPPAQLRPAVERLEAAGFELADRNWSVMRRRVGGELHLQRHGCAPVDLHWTLLFNDALRQALRFDTLAMIERARTVDVAGGAVRTFDPADTLLHLAVHGALEGGDRLVWLKDLDVVVRAGVSWDDVVARARGYGVHVTAATMLARARRVLATPVPSEVEQALAPRTWRAVCAVADRTFPAPRSRGLGTPATLVARAARADLRSTVAVALGGVTRRASALARGRVRRVDHRDDPTHHTSLRHPLGGAADRDAYFALVAERGREITASRPAG